MAEPRQEAGTAATVCAALFTPTVLFISAPSAIILRNLLDIPHSWATVRVFLVLFVCSAGVAAAVFRLAHTSRVCAVLLRVCLLAGSLVLIYSALSALHENSERPLVVLATLDILAAALAALLVFRLGVDVLVRVFGAIGVVLLVSGVGNHAHRLVRAEREARARSVKAAEVRAAARSATGAKAGNVYHIILDAFQTEAYQMLAAREPAYRFPGFTHFTEFTAHYARTNHSVPNALNGRFYRDGESMWAWREEAFSGGLWAALVSAGVELHLYPHYPPYCTPLAATCRAAISLADSMQYVRATASPTNITIDLWFLSLLPPSLRTAINAPFTVDPNIPRGGDEYYGFSLTTALGADVTENVERRDDVPDYTHSGAYSMLNFEHLLAEEATRPAHGQYVFLHAIVPHWPFVVDAECRYIGQSSAAPYDAYMAQAVCALRIVERLVAELKRLDRFDDALIVVHADHGGKGGALMLQVHPEQWPGPPYGSDLEWLDGDRIESDMWPHHLVDVYRRALLLVKRPGATAFSTSPLPVQTIDLAPTVLSHVGADHSAFPGMPLDAIPAAPAREPVFFASNAIPDAHVPRQFDEYRLREGKWTHRADLRTAR